MNLARGLNYLTKKLQKLSMIMVLSLIGFQSFGLPVIAQNVVISEFMQNPVSISDDNGEWIELRNLENNTHTMTNWKVRINGVASDSFSGDINPNGYFVICRSNSIVNVSCNTFVDFELANSGSRTVELLDGTESTVDSVTYNGSTAGKSQTVTENADGSKSLSNDNTNIYTNSGANNDYGTPGTINPDNTSPTHNLTNLVGGDITVGASFNVEGSAFDGGWGLKSARLLIDGNPVSPYEAIELEGFNDDYRFSNIMLSEGLHTINVVVEDHAGNTAGLSDPLEITVDTTAPDVTVDSQQINNRSPQITGTVDDPNSSVEVTVDGITYSDADGLTLDASDNTWSLPAGVIAPPLNDGTYDVHAVATDEYGNSQADTTSAELFVDATAPKLTVDKLTTSDRSPEITGTIDDLLVSAIFVTVNGKTYSAAVHGDGTWSLSGQELVSAGTYGSFDVVAEATDSLGNFGADTTTDELTIVRLVESVTNNASKTVTSMAASFVAATTTQGDADALDSDGDGIPDDQDSTPFGEEDKDNNDKDTKSDDKDKVASQDDSSNDAWRWVIFGAAVAAFLWFMLKSRDPETS